VTRQVNGLKIANTNDAIAIPLVLATGGAGGTELLLRLELHELQTFASSGFSAPHFGQYIFHSPLNLILG
jgi:hypothetical protein